MGKFESSSMTVLLQKKAIDPLPLQSEHN